MNGNDSRTIFAIASAAVLAVGSAIVASARKAPPVIAANGKRGAQVFALLAVFVGGWEGSRNLAYQDIGGVWTVCFGETRGVQKGDYFTDEQCEAMLGRGLIEFAQAVDRCLTDPARVPDRSYAAFVSLAYNIGPSAFCGSTLVRLANAGDLRGACDQILVWNKVNREVVNGLVNRRKAEHAMCLEGLAA